MQLATLLNSTETSWRITGDKPTVQLAFDGRDNALSVKVYEHGFGRGMIPNFDVIVCLDWEDMERRLDRYITYLENLCEKCGIPTNEHYMKVTTNG